MLDACMKLQNYPIKTVGDAFDVLLNYSEDSKETQLQSPLYFKDTVPIWSLLILLLEATLD